MKRLSLLLPLLLTLVFGALPQRADASLYLTYQAFAWVGSTSGSYTPHSAYASNSTGGSILVTWTGTGQARVDFGNFSGADGGNVQVVAYNSFGARCKVASWVLSGSTMSVYVRCHNASGALQSTPFVAVFGGKHDANAAWLWAHNATASHTPSATYSFNSKGQTNTVTRNGVGDYTVSTPGLNMWGGNVQVTAYGTGSEYCKVRWWSNDSAGVACFNNAGAPADSMFSFRRLSTGGYYGFKSSYVWGDNPTAASYTPSTTYQEYASCTAPNNVFNCVAGTDNTAGRSSTGTYWVSYPGVSSSPTAALVTSYGWDNTYCNITSWGTSTVYLRCFSPGGTPTDARYSQLFLSRW